MEMWKGSMAQDLKSAVEFVKSLEKDKRSGAMRDEELVLLGHSAGGELVQ
jgi:alpha-beta hydrolase superfamily lysophospholipase